MGNGSGDMGLEPSGFSELRAFPRNDYNYPQGLHGEQFFIWFPRWEMLHAHFLEFPKESHPMTWNRAGKVRSTLRQRLRGQESGGRKEEGRSGNRGVGSR